MSTTPLNFAPYSEPPEVVRPRWQPPVASTSSSSYQAGGSIEDLGPQTSFSSSGSVLPGHGSTGGTTYWNGGGGTGREVRLWRTDYEAAGAYALGLFSAVLLLVGETESDYVRFHAYQSGLLSVALVLLHIVFLPFPAFFESLLLGFDVIFLGFLALRAYRDTEELIRYKLPYIGLIAERWVEEE